MLMWYIVIKCLQTLAATNIVMHLGIYGESYALLVSLLQDML